MRRPPVTTAKQILPCFLIFVLVVGLAVSWAWWYPWILWRNSKVSWTELGPGVPVMLLSLLKNSLLYLDYKYMISHSSHILAVILIRDVGRLHNIRASHGREQKPLVLRSRVGQAWTFLFTVSVCELP